MIFILCKYKGNYESRKWTLLKKNKVPSNLEIWKNINPILVIGNRNFDIENILLKSIFHIFQGLFIISTLGIDKLIWPSCILINKFKLILNPTCGIFKTHLTLVESGVGVDGCVRGEGNNESTQVLSHGGSKSIFYSSTTTWTKFYPILIPSPLKWTNMDILCKIYPRSTLCYVTPVDFLLTPSLPPFCCYSMLLLNETIKRFFTISGFSF